MISCSWMRQSQYVKHLCSYMQKEASSLLRTSNDGDVQKSKNEINSTCCEGRLAVSKTSTERSASISVTILALRFLHVKQWT